MLAEMGAEEFEERMAADIIDPMDNTYMLASLTATLTNNFTRIISIVTQQRPTKRDFVDIDDYLPKVTTNGNQSR